MSRMAPSFEHENGLANEGFQYIAGVDEAGRGAWAGPVTAGAVILPLTSDCLVRLADVRDSKQLSASKRDKCRVKIEEVALALAVGHASCLEIDELGIVPATRLAMVRAINALAIQPDALIIDAVRLPTLAIRQDVFYFA
ncbi:MAG TPA: ribonuclease HII, partial [Anaerolineae bacterium]